MVHFFQEGPELFGGMYFIYAGDPLFLTMFLDTDIAKTIGSGPGPERSLARTLGTCAFCLRASE